LTHDTPFITTMAIGLGLALLLALVAHRMRLPLIAGYLLAGVLLGPFTPGFVADQEVASELAEMGVILLMFGVGLHFSFNDLMAVRAIALPGAIAQIAVATLCGMVLALALGLGWGAGLVFGLCLSVASTVVLLRALQDNHLTESEQGKIAVGWLVVEDMIMIFALVLIPPLAGLLGGDAAPIDADTAKVAALGIGTVGAVILVTLAKIAAFVLIMLLIGSRLIPAILHYTARTGERELFRLSVLAVALGVAFASSSVFGVSFALGAFFAGMAMAGSTLSAQAMRDMIPFRDAFAVLFFVSVGMLFDPSILWRSPLEVLATVFIIIVVKSTVAYAIVRAFGRSHTVAATIAASLAQIGEFSFVLVVMGAKFDILTTVERDLVVAGALISILLNPLLFRLLGKTTNQPPPAPV
jgi:monovalent cation:H+ antiporter-2, CPA2 family